MGKQATNRENTSFSLGLCFIIDGPGADLGYTLLALILLSKVISYSAQWNNLVHVAAPLFCRIGSCIHIYRCQILVAVSSLGHIGKVSLYQIQKKHMELISQGASRACLQWIYCLCGPTPVHWSLKSLAGTVVLTPIFFSLPALSPMEQGRQGGNSTLWTLSHNHVD